MSKYKPNDLIYKATKAYQDDINDLIEDDLQKGGIGSGKRGHKTVRPLNVRNEEKYKKVEAMINSEIERARNYGTSGSLARIKGLKKDLKEAKQRLKYCNAAGYKF